MPQELENLKKGAPPPSVKGIPSPQQSLPALASAKVPTSFPETQADSDTDEDFISNSKKKPVSNVGEPEGLVTPQQPRPKPSPSSAPQVARAPVMTQSERRAIMAQPNRLPNPDSPNASPRTSPGTLVNSDGTLQSFPGTHMEAEPFESDWDEIPDISDALAPRFKTNEHHLSPEAIRSRSKRIFTKRADGSKKVSDEIWNDWKSKGNKRRLLEDIFKRCGYDPETWFVTLISLCILRICVSSMGILWYSLPGFSNSEYLPPLGNIHLRG